MIYDLPLNSITADDIQALVTDHVGELKYLEYKQQLPDNTNEAKHKFIASVISFANAQGGLIIYGIKENENGEAQEIINIESENTNKDFLRLLQLIQDNIEPRINMPEIREIYINANKLYLIKILPSYSKPHREKNTQKFYGRTSKGRYELSVDELKTLFLLSSTVEEKMEKFKLNRLIKLKNNDFPFKFYTDKLVILQIAPLESLMNNVKIEIDKENTYESFFPLEASGHNHLYNFDGRIHYQCAQDGNKSVISYVQLFRNGIIETVNSNLINSTEKKIYGKDLEKSIKDTIDRYINNLNKIGITYPFYIGISILNIKGYRIQSPNQMGMNIFRSVWGDFGGIYSNDIILPTIYVDNKEELDNEFTECFKIFWNTDGFPCSPKE